MSLLHLWINSAKILSYSERLLCEDTVLKGLGVLLNTVAYGSTNCKLCKTNIQILVLIDTPSLLGSVGYYFICLLKASY